MMFMKVCLEERVVAFDYNNDGYEDLYITGEKSQDILYKNNGNGTFKDVINGSGLLKDSLMVTTGVSSADVNKDGYIDLLVTTITSQNNHPNDKNKMSSNLLYINNGDGTFSDLTSKYGIQKRISLHPLLLEILMQMVIQIYLLQIILKTSILTIIH